MKNRETRIKLIINIIWYFDVIFDIILGQAPLIAACMETFHRLERAAEMQRREQVINGIENDENLFHRTIKDQSVEEVVSAESVQSSGVTVSNSTSRRNGKLKPVRCFGFPSVTNRLDLFQLKSSDEPLHPTSAFYQSNQNK